MLPSFRPDKALGIEKPDYPDYLARLGEIKGFAQLVQEMERRIARLKEEIAELEQKIKELDNA